MDNVAEIKLIYSSKVKPSERAKVICPQDAYKVFLETWDRNQIEFKEQFKVMLLNRANRVLGIYVDSIGGVAGTVIELKHVFYAAMKANACSMIMAHNHPSGNLQFSTQDMAITKKAKQIGQFLDIKVIDHLIVTTEGYRSSSEEGII
ncbi:JAB domain-containing protein [Reichenbachiella versicolor]|uniref:JAB domain-containing protein n=1 Tax=Reichenbachiella versicolor TaxID=1821036 RepID=UPI000D6DF9EC|nr:JAB domain-containing protein [Reichenbachiella versicolor]